MERDLTASEHFTLDDIRETPNLVTDFLLKDEDVSVILQKRGDTVHLAYLRAYDAETTRILAEAKREHAGKVKEGYTREQALTDFAEAQDEIDQSR